MSVNVRRPSEHGRARFGFQQTWRARRRQQR